MSNEYQNWLENLPVGVYRMTPAGQFMEINAALVVLLGYPDRATLLSQSVADLHMNPTCFVAHCQRLEQAGTLHGVAYPLRAYSGQEVWVADSARVVYDAGGQVESYVGVWQVVPVPASSVAQQDVAPPPDNTERLLLVAQQALRKLEVLYQLHYTMSMGLNLHDMFQTLVASTLDALSVQGAALHIYHQDTGEILHQVCAGDIPHNWMHLAFRQPPSTACLQAHQMFAPLHLLPPWQGVLWVMNPPATRHFEQTDLALLTSMASQASSIITNEQLSEELRASEERFRHTFEQAAVGIAHVAPDGHFLRINQRFCDIVGYTQAEMLSLTFQAITHPDDMAVSLRYAEQALSGEQPTYTLEKRYRRKDGQIIWANLTGTLLYTPTGAPDYFVSVIEDITARKMTESALAERTYNLNERVKELRCLYELSQLIEEPGVTWERILAGSLDLLIAAFQYPSRAGGQLTYEHQVFATPNFRLTASVLTEDIFKAQVPVGKIEVVYFDQPSEPGGVAFLPEEAALLRVVAKRLGRVSERLQFEVALQEKLQQLEVLSNVLQTITASLNYDEIITSVQPLMRVFGSDYQVVILPARQQPFFVATDRAAVPEALQSVPALQPLLGGGRAVLGLPLVVGEESVGLMCLSSAQPQDFTTQQPLLLSLANQIAIALKNAQLYEQVRLQRQQLRALLARLAETEESDRRWLAQELHDHVGQNLTALGLSLQIVISMLPQEPTHPATARLRDAQELVRQVSKRLREMMSDLRPPVLESYGLLAAIQWYSAQFSTRTGIAVKVQGESPPAQLPVSIENALFRITQESLTNVAKHARASEVEIKLESNDPRIRLTIRDNGIGFGMTARTPTLQAWGVISMQERAEAIGGTCEITSALGQGTCIVVEVS